ncbi:MAG: heparan-alpha-glucosaminide N-acetyltransferase domain-containing protein, partial [Fibrobacterota bacterium]
MEESKLTAATLISPVLLHSKPRVLAFDFARGIAILMMVLIHTAVFIGGHDLINTPTGHVVNSFVCIFAAPVFMFVMGILFSISSKTTFGVQLSRGFLILLLGYALNFLRGTLPVAAGMLFGWIEGDFPLEYMLEDDILQFAGIALIAMTIVKRAIPWSPGWLLLGLVAAFVSPFVWNQGSDNAFINYILSLFCGGEEYNYFPFFPWIAFPLIGMAYGDYFKKAKDQKHFFITGSYLGIILII